MENRRRILGCRVLLQCVLILKVYVTSFKFCFTALMMVGMMEFMVVTAPYQTAHFYISHIVDRKFNNNNNNNNSGTFSESKTKSHKNYTIYYAF